MNQLLDKARAGSNVSRQEFGDFQTPPGLAREICALLRREGIDPHIVIEPTCGLGAFLVAAAEAFPAARILGFEVNADYLETTQQSLKNGGASSRFDLRAQDFFTHNWDAECKSVEGSLLLLGNPPWVTNAAVARLNGSNLPVKENFLGFRGLEARTGKSNFDISEWMLIRLLRALDGRKAAIAMLCKTATARKVLRYAWQNDGRVASASLYRIDATAHFSASVDACLLLAHIGAHGATEAAVFDSLQARTPSSHLGLVGKDLVADIRAYRRLQHLEGRCPYQWRSGLKHDCASVMELRPNPDGTFSNKLKEQVSLEPDCVYPLLKCTDLSKGNANPTRFVLMTQKRVGEDTRAIARHAPRTWEYLNAHADYFQARKSSIYKNGVPFAIFGVGDYSFAPWKVAVSGLHREPRFVLVGPQEDRPVMFDDTCYFLSFPQENEARLVAQILNTTQCREFLASLIFPDSKRPVTVELLRRLNLRAIAQDAGLAGLWETILPQMTMPGDLFRSSLSLEGI
ncbi:MAG: SAM-dependent methyltransferase [Verrucomicrobia bacterium]|nr:SAM-dependent methyltransferase [Verrucomicrobiota bacterium]